MRAQLRLRTLPASAPARGVTAAVALAAFLAGWLVFRTRQPTFDGAHHLAVARDLAAYGIAPPATLPPGFCALLAGPLRALGPDGPDAPLRVAQGLNLAAFLLQGLLAHAFARRRLPPWPAAAVAALTLLLPSQLARAAGDTPEPVFGCLLLAGALLRERERRWVAGLVWGAAYLVRPDALVVVLAAALADAAQTRRLPWRLLLGCALVVGPSTAHLHASAGRWLFTGDAIALEQTLAGPPTPVTATRAAANVGDVARALAATAGIPLATSALLCAVMVGGRWLLLALPMLALPLLPIRLDPRSLAPYLPVWLTAAWLAVPLVQEVATGRRARWAAPVVAGVLLLGAAGAALGQARAVAAGPDQFPGLRAAGLWLRSRVTRHEIVVSATPFPSYWAWCRFARVPEGVAASRVLAWARATGADWLVLDAHSTVTRAPELLPLLEEPPEQLRDQVELVETFRIEGRQDQATYLYRIVGTDASVAGPQEAARR